MYSPDSPCWDCRHCKSDIITDDYWAGPQYDEDCEEGAPEGVFGGEWGCYYFEERVDPNE